MGLTGQPPCESSLQTVASVSLTYRPRLYDSSFFPQEKEMSSNTLSQSYSFLPPNAVSGCTLWLDGADASTVALSGANVTSWTDKSGTGRNATAIGTGPTYSSNGLVFNNSELLRGTANYLQNSSTGNWSMFSVFRPTNITTNNPRILTSQGAPNNVAQFLYIESQTLTSFVWLQSGQSQAFGSSVSINTTYLASVVNTTSNTIIYTNGTAGTAATHGPASLSSNTYYYVGGFEAPGDRYIGSLFEIIIFGNDTTTAQRQQIEGYLAWKWSLQGNLPANHPFKTAPPFANNPRLPPSLYPSGPIRMAPSSSPFVFFSPASLSSLATWLDATDLTTLYSDSNGTTLITSNSSPVRYWRDKSTNANNMRVSAAPNPPSFQTGSFNAQPALLFSNAYFNAVTLSKISVQTASIFAFYKSNQGAGTQGPVVYGAITGTSQELGMYPNYYFHRHNNGNDNGVSITDTYQPLVGEILYSDSSLLYFNNFNNISPAAPVLGTPGNVFYSGYFNIGNYQNAIDQNFQAYVGEVIIYNRLLSTIERQQIEGYLAWKWGLPANLPASHPYKNAPPNATGLALPPVPLRLAMNSRVFQPTSITGCQMWLDAADPSTVSLSGSNVTSWADKSGNGNTPSQATGSNQPTYGSNTLTFNGTSSFLYTALASSLTVSSGYTIAVVSMQTSQNGGYQRLLGMNETSAPNAFFWGGLSGNLVIDIGNSTNWANNATAISPTVSMLQRNISIATFSTGGLAPFVNGATYTLRSSALNTPIPNLYIGCGFFSGSTQQFWPGTVNEILVFSSALSITQRQSVEGYLAWKWGLQGNLPNNHPFKRFPPPP